MLATELLFARMMPRSRMEPTGLFFALLLLFPELTSSSIGRRKGFVCSIVVSVSDAKLIACGCIPASNIKTNMMLRIASLSIGDDREFGNQALAVKAGVMRMDREALDYNKAQLVVQFL
jgi:hypothetical protein